MLDWLRNLLGESVKVQRLAKLAHDANAACFEAQTKASSVERELGLLRAEIAFQLETANELGFELQSSMSGAAAISALLHDLAPLVEKGRRFEAKRARDAELKRARRAAGKDSA